MDYSTQTLTALVSDRMVLNKELVLGSASARRAEILEKAGFSFKIDVKPTSERFPKDLNLEAVPEYLAKQKINEYDENFKDKIVLCADTVVILNNQLLNKPKDYAEAKLMLESLSGQKHQVITGVAIKVNGNVKTFADECIVEFAELNADEIAYYLKACKPFDKAGSYGIQDFIGMAGVKHLNGSFYAVMGLPIHLVYAALKEYIVW